MQIGFQPVQNKVMPSSPSLRQSSPTLKNINDSAHFGATSSVKSNNTHSQALHFGMRKIFGDKDYNKEMEKFLAADNNKTTNMGSGKFQEKLQKYIDKGVNPNNILLYGIGQGRNTQAFVKFLTDKGANAGVTDAQQNNALHKFFQIPLKGLSLEAFKHLLNSIAKQTKPGDFAHLHIMQAALNHPNNEGITPLQLLAHNMSKNGEQALEQGQAIVTYCGTKGLDMSSLETTPFDRSLLLTGSLNLEDLTK
jgi:hypothetical protein